MKKDPIEEEIERWIHFLRPVMRNDSRTSQLVYLAMAMGAMLSMNEQGQPSAKANKVISVLLSKASAIKQQRASLHLVKKPVKKKSSAKE